MNLWILEEDGKETGGVLIKKQLVVQTHSFQSYIKLCLEVNRRTLCSEPGKRRWWGPVDAALKLDSGNLCSVPGLSIHIQTQVDRLVASVCFLIGSHWTLVGLLVGSPSREAEDCTLSLRDGSFSSRLTCIVSVRKT